VWLAAPPAAPTLGVVMTTGSSVQLNWMSGGNGGSRILGFVLYHRRHHSVDWASRRLSAANRSASRFWRQNFVNDVNELCSV